MTSMREKIARKAYVVLHGSKAPEDMSVPYASASKIGKAYKVADAVLDALMEPTEGMVAAMDEHSGTIAPECAYQAGIQAARDGA